ncbi:hypothetical protein [Sphingomonas nostoxanthinifaciens]|nr:hypothetical protein [Sphingomonas nostoxanthinifaciens]UAK25653.1 hypothetical protein K8P63_05775 [Sphingomonas nostoxanthinifaciens]
MSDGLRLAALSAALLLAACATISTFDPNPANVVDNAPCPTTDGTPCK